MAGKVLAYFEIQRADRDGDETPSIIEIRGNEEFYLGRNTGLCRHTWSDPVISNKHLRIHCILFEQNPVADIPPLVYATDVSSNGTWLRKSNAECSSSQGRGIRMGRKNGSFLLDEGDQLQLSPSIAVVYHSIAKIRAEQLPAVQQRERQAFAARYVVTDRELGAGGYGKVLIAIHQKTQRQLACKVIDLRAFYDRDRRTTAYSRYEGEGQGVPDTPKRWPTRVGKCFREFDILKDLTHPNIVTIEKVFWSSNSIYIFQELVTGGDLFSYLEYKGYRLCDVEAAVIVRQILKGVLFLHDQNIVHRDLKPDNILMTSLDDGARIVITDFGNARFLPEEENIAPDANARGLFRRRMFSLCGTLEYTAPEIHSKNPTVPSNQGYSKSIDMWSIGSIACALLSGEAPFADRLNLDFDREPLKVMMRLASRCDLSFLDDDEHPIWSKVGSRPKDFIKKLVVLEEDKRLTAAEALAHPWFSNKYHAAAFEALYQRAVRDWRPRRKIFRLVEPIAETTEDLSGVGLPEDFLSQEVVSKYFSVPRRPTSQYQIRSSQIASQPRHSSTPLPAILEEMEDDDYNCAHEIADNESYDLNDVNHDIRGSYPMHFSRGYDLDDSMEQLALSPEDEGLYGIDYDPDQERTRNDEPGRPEFGASQISAEVPTPEQDDDSLVVPETPMRYYARRRREMGGSRNESMSSDCESSAKRIKLA